MKTLLGRILCSAAASVWAKDQTLGKYCSETEQHELNLAFHFACELRNWLPWLNCDFDVSKRAKPDPSDPVDKKRHKRPDIILHVRTTHALNFLVVELKRYQSGSVAKKADLQRLRHNWMDAPYKYRFGASMIMADDNKRFNLQLLDREHIDEKPVLLDSSKLGRLPHLPNRPIDDLKAMVEKITATKQYNFSAETITMERELDKLVHSFYGEPFEENNTQEAITK